MLAATPVLTRQYSPAEVGLWTIFVSVVTMFQSVVNWRYELAIMLPRDDDEAAHVFGLTILAALVSSVLLLVCLVAARRPFAAATGAEAIAGWLWSVPAVVFLAGVHQAGIYWVSRQRRFAAVSVARIGLSAATVSTQIGGGILGQGLARWLVAGTVAGQVVGTLFVVVQALRLGLSTGLRSLSWNKLVRCAICYRNFPLYNLPYIFVGRARERLVFFVLGAYATTHAVGLYGMASKVCLLPTSLIGMSVSVVFFQRAAAETDLRQVGRVITHGLVTMTLLGPPALVLFAFDAPWLFATVLGDRWEDAGRYAQLLAVPAFLALLTTSFDRVLDVLRRQRLALLLEVVFTLAAAGALAAATQLSVRPLVAVGAYAAVCVVCQLAWLVFVFRAGSFPLSALARVGALFVGIASASALVRWLAVAWLGTKPGLAVVAIACVLYYARLLAPRLKRPAVAGHAAGNAGGALMP